MGKTRLTIGVGTGNEVKLRAVREVIADYPELAAAEIESFAAPSAVSDQPRSLAETIAGAKNRARYAGKRATWGIGIEDGFAEVPQSEVGFMNVCVCAIQAGERCYLGFSPAFECPADVVKRVMGEGMDLNQAMLAAGRTTHPRIGSEIGAIGVFTGGQIPRDAYTKQAVHMALVRAREGLE